MIKNILKMTLILLTLSLPAEARWATIEDAPLEIQVYNENMKVNADGTSENIIEIKQKILKESARARASNYTLYYNGDSSKITILEAKTIYQGKEYKVNADLIEDKPLASAPSGFDQQRQILIAYPKVEIGSEVYIKYSFKELKPVLNNYFATKVNLIGGYIKNYNLNLTSEMPLHIKVNDPENVLRVTNQKKDNLNKLSIKLTKPFYRDVVNEPQNGVINNKHLTWVSISSVKEWDELGKRLGAGYEKVINQPLPETFKNILNEASKGKTEVEQINIVTSLLNDKIQYMGDWRSIAGRYFPRNLALIESSQIGDCKDFTASTASILKHLGFKVQPAAVLRGTNNMSFYGGLPDVSDFNHAFLKVTGKLGKVYWIDPTNFISMADGMFADVAEKMALVLDSKNPSYEKTNSIDPNHSQVVSIKEIEKINGKVANSGHLILKGEQATDYAGAKMYLSDQRIRDAIFHRLSGIHLEEENKKELLVPDLSSRIVKDIDFKFKYFQDNQIIRTNLGPGITLDYKWLEFAINNSPDQVSDLLLDFPLTLNKTTVIKNQLIKQISALNYEVNSPWLSVKRKCDFDGKDTVINDVITVKQTFIPSQTLKTREYKSLKHELKKNFLNTLIILDK
ncbi:MAG: DUF3857 domain-containing protein [Sphingobacteriia bacterium]|nr:DUF3857 domain-containing protein [Sphingobacteriia bacterium]